MSTEPAKSVEQTAQLKLRDHLLNGLTISTGAIDAISFLAIGKVFTAFMTGNIVFLGLRIAGSSDAPSFLSILSSMGGFAVGVYLATRIVTNSRASARLDDETASASTWPAGTTRALGVSLLAQAGFLAVWCSTGGTPMDNTAPVLLVLWGLAMGIQSATVRGLKVEGVLTTAATATYLSVMGDLASHRLSGIERRRLCCILISLCVGATAGSLFVSYHSLFAPGLPFAITFAVLAIAAATYRTTVAPATKEPGPTHDMSS